MIGRRVCKRLRLSRGLLYYHRGLNALITVTVSSTYTGDGESATETLLVTSTVTATLTSTVTATTTAVAVSVEWDLFYLYVETEDSDEEIGPSPGAYASTNWILGRSDITWGALDPEDAAQFYLDNAGYLRPAPASAPNDDTYVLYDDTTDDTTLALWSPSQVDNNPAKLKCVTPIDPSTRLLSCGLDTVCHASQFLDCSPRAERYAGIGLAGPRPSDCYSLTIKAVPVVA